jgi:hypothetical protein
MNKENQKILIESLKSYLYDLEDTQQIKTIVKSLDEKKNKIEVAELKTLITLLKSEEFQKDLVNVQKINLENLVNQMNTNFEYLQKKKFFKYYSHSNFIKLLKKVHGKQSEPKNVFLLGSGCGGVIYLTNQKKSTFYSSLYMDQNTETENHDYFTESYSIFYDNIKLPISTISNHYFKQKYTFLNHIKDV